MTGFIRKKFGLSVGQNRVGNALATVCPRNHQQRREGTFRQVNPIPYRADYFGHKMHFDQNEKLVMSFSIYRGCLYNACTEQFGYFRGSFEVCFRNE